MNFVENLGEKKSNVWEQGGNVGVFSPVSRIFIYIYRNTAFSQLKLTFFKLLFYKAGLHMIKPPSKFFL